MVDLDIGVLLPTLATHDGSLGDVAAAARHAEELGFESVWVVDQLIAGTGIPVLESLTSLAAAAAVTSRIRLGVGVLVLPLRPLAWTAKQVASLQHLSGDRLLLGVGIGGDRHDRSWAAAGVPVRERGRRTDDALRLLPDLISGKPTHINSAAIQLSPPATVPPIIIGGMSDAAVRRAAAHDGWFLLGPSDGIPAHRVRLEAAANGRATPPLTANAMVAIQGDPALPDHPAILNSLSDPDGMFGIPVEHVESSLAHGDTGVIAEHLNAFAVQGAGRVVVTLVAGDWFRQAELLAQACGLL
ncbi:LLM class flavin-dependent oxidoreductase [Nocardia panacis]|uniref:LLM class flavin-dependent oxidoreductase n=1 Tax=Nocardia panacis TaxID=2340916 RepID=A0A3A4K2U3_9NOCA|nr:LLM class flavin-dependent oxidoreductase [Nocardia panacis]RJO70774.1 LLM class flavin-dependent oxidoreductase [Nocardia panacis]